MSPMPSLQAIAEGLLVEARGLGYADRAAAGETTVLSDVDLEVGPRETVALVGRSASGKTTLLELLAGLRRPTAGRLRVAGHDLAEAPAGALSDYRRDLVGLVLQAPETGLWPGLTALENVLLPMLTPRRGRRDRTSRAAELLEAMGLRDAWDRRPAGMTPAETQRLSVAVALANEPRLLLVDEPTGELDDDEAGALVGDLLRLLRGRGLAAVVATADPRLTTIADRVVRLPDQPDAANFAHVGELGSAALGPPADAQPDRPVVLGAEALFRSFTEARRTVRAIHGVNLSVGQAELVAVLGPAASGKSTLLALCGGLDRPELGRVVVAQQDLATLHGEAREAFLRRTVAWVRPRDGLPPRPTAAECVSVSARIGGAPPGDADELSRLALEATGLERRGRHPAGRLSRGEQHRLVLAKALVRTPALLLADEPTAQLDRRTAAGCLALLRDAADAGAAVLLATRSREVAAVADRVMLLESGILRPDG